jgi:hypothetical protein
MNLIGFPKRLAILDYAPRVDYLTETAKSLIREADIDYNAWNDSKRTDCMDTQEDHISEHCCYIVIIITAYV